MMERLTMKCPLMPALIFAAIAACAASAQVPNAPADSQDVVVEGRTPAAAKRYVDKLAYADAGHQLARWDAPICLRIDGLGDKYAAFIRARFITLAKTAGVTLAAPDCRTVNVIVTMSEEADALAKALVHSRPRAIGNLVNNTLLQPSEVKALEAPHTVRWMTATLTAGPDGAGMSNAKGGPSPTNYLFADSLIKAASREVKVSTIVLIDQKRLEGATMRQLSDYLAFVILATPDIRDDFSKADSILSVFSAKDRAIGPITGLTRQDRHFLEALYTTPPARSADDQRAAIRAKMSADMSD